VTFLFPALTPALQPANVEYKHYQDADLVTVDAKQVAAGVKLVSQVGNGLRNVVILGLLAAALVGLILYLRRKVAKAHTPVEALTIPAQLTPFPAVAFLRRIQQHHASRLGANDGTALKAQIAELEAGYFSGGQAPSLDLAAVLKKWLQAVS
jgi:hypothetical protein